MALKLRIFGNTFIDLVFLTAHLENFFKTDNVQHLIIGELIMKTKIMLFFLALCSMNYTYASNFTYIHCGGKHLGNEFKYSDPQRKFEICSKDVFGKVKRLALQS